MRNSKGRSDPFKLTVPIDPRRISDFSPFLKVTRDLLRVSKFDLNQEIFGSRVKQYQNPGSISRFTARESIAERRSKVCAKFELDYSRIQD